MAIGLLPTLAATGVLIASQSGPAPHQGGPFDMALSPEFNAWMRESDRVERRDRDAESAGLAEFPAGASNYLLYLSPPVPGEPDNGWTLTMGPADRRRSDLPPPIARVAIIRGESSIEIIVTLIATNFLSQATIKR